MLGTLGSFFIGKRIYKIVLSIKKDYAKPQAERAFSSEKSF